MWDYVRKHEIAWDYVRLFEKTWDCVCNSTGIDGMNIVADKSNDKYCVIYLATTPLYILHNIIIYYIIFLIYNTLAI